EQFDIINIKSIYTSNIDISFNNIMLPLLVFILVAIFIISFNIYNFRIIPLYLQKILEYIYIFIVSMIKQQAGNYGLYCFPFIFTLFSIILFCNLLSLIPFGIALTSHL